MAPPASLPARRLGKTGPEITALGVGLMGLSVAYGKPGFVTSDQPAAIKRQPRTNPMSSTDPTKSVSHSSTAPGSSAPRTGTQPTPTATTKTSLASGSRCTLSAAPTSSWRPSLACAGRSGTTEPLASGSTARPNTAERRASAA